MRVGPKGQVVIPQAVRRELGIGPGDEVHVEEYEGGALVRKVTSDLLGLLADGPGSVGMEDFEAARRREREREEPADGHSGGAAGT